MTVKELIEELQKLPQDVVVLLSSDEEGNSFNPFSGDFTLGRKGDGESAWKPGFITKDDWEYENEEPYPGDDSVVMWP